MIPTDRVFNIIAQCLNVLREGASWIEAASPMLNTLKKMQAKRTQNDKPVPLFAPPVHMEEGPSWSEYPEVLTDSFELNCFVWSKTH
jgi:hypothetical protein